MAEQFDLFAESETREPEPPEKPGFGIRVLYFDLETQKGVDEVGGWSNIHLMKMAVGVVWDSLDRKFYAYGEERTADLVKKLKSSDLVVGFNVIGFDYTVLQPYSEDFDLGELNTFDMLLDIKKQLGFRLSLNHLAQYTLNAAKSADGLISLQWFREAREREAAGDTAGKKEKMDQIIEYCTKDVEITRDLFLFGEQNGYVCYKDRNGGDQRVSVDWKVANLI